MILSKYVIAIVLIFSLHTHTAIEPPQPKIIALHNFTVTAYCFCNTCNGHWGAQTCEGIPFQYFFDNNTKICAVDKIVIPLGSWIQYNGEIYWAKDVGGQIKGNHIDILMPTHEIARQFGRKTNQTIYMVGK